MREAQEDFGGSRGRKVAVERGPDEDLMFILRNGTLFFQDFSSKYDAAARGLPFPESGRTATTLVAPATSPAGN